MINPYHLVVGFLVTVILVIVKTMLVLWEQRRYNRRMRETVAKELYRIQRLAKIR